jgi:6-phosphogluconolactonase (cycloisomerase 2 family)
MTNALGNNEIKVYHRATDGNLTLVQTIATGGGGSGLQLAGVDSLGSAGSVQLDPSHHLLFAVNAESANSNNGAGTYNSDCQQGSITSFLVSSNGMLTFANKAPSGGLFPNSLAVQNLGNGDDGNGNGKGDGNSKASRDGNDDNDKPNGVLLYVLNAGGPGNCNVSPNVKGFQVDGTGHMQAVTAAQLINPGPPVGTGANCSAASAAGFAGLTGAPVADFACGLNPPSFPRSPAQVKFTPDGSQLIVTVKGTSSIYVFPLDGDGRAGDPAAGPTIGTALPSFFGFTFDKTGHMLVTELFGSATSIPAGGQGAVSSYLVSNSGSLSAISSHVGDGGTAACWIALEPKNGKFAYVANNLSASISSYAVASNGGVTLLNGTAATGTGPNDLAAVSENGSSWLYVVDAGTGTVGAFQINLTNGALTAITGGAGLPTNSAQGLAAF